MQYHIDTAPIWEAFKSDCDCPVCRLYAQNEERLVGQYLNEAVMEPEYRVKVNEYGFCKEHLKKLFAGKNKLGLSLQLSTRLQAVKSNIGGCFSHKQAIKQAETLDKTMDTCVICSDIEKTLLRYAITVAQMFYNEPEFRTLFGKSGGFCMPHYSLLLKTSGKAGKLSGAYASELVAVQSRALDRTIRELDRFAEMFDYRNAGSGVKPDPDTLPNAINRLKGRII